MGDILEVMAEGYDPVSETFYGRSKADAPDIDGKVFFTSGKRCTAGEIIKVKITESMDYDLIGEALPF